MKKQLNNYVQKTKLFLLLITLMSLTGQAQAEYAHDQSISNLLVNDAGEVLIGLNEQPDNTCNNWGWYLKLSTASEGGKNLYSLLLTAQATNSKIRVWYTASSAPETDHNSGCNNHMAIVNSIAIPTEQ